MFNIQEAVTTSERFLRFNEEKLTNLNFNLKFAT